MIKVIIFDLDGLLIDSQPLQYRAYNHVFSKYGSPISIEEWHEWIMNSYSTDYWIKRNNLKLDPEAIREEKQELYKGWVKDELNLKPGARYVIDLLFKKYKLCVASASRIDSIELILDKFNFISKFKKLLSDHNVTNRKPYPDIFLKAAVDMNAKPKECIVIEDSVAGLKAAKAAGMKCIICRDSFSNFPLSFFEGADKIVGSLEGITFETIEELDS